MPLKPFCAATTNLEQDKQWGLCSCNMTQPGPVDFSLTFNLVFRKPPTEDSSKYFVYYPDLMLRSVTEGGMYPMSGPMESRTTLRLRGSNFSDAGQTIHCLFADRFGINTTRPAKRVDDELRAFQVRCVAWVRAWGHKGRTSTTSSCSPSCRPSSSSSRP